MTGSLRPAAVTLLNAETDVGEIPLLMTQQYGRGHAWIMASGGTWRWQMSMPVEDQSHETFWRQLLRALVAAAPNSVSLQASGNAGSTGVSLRAEFRDDASFSGCQFRFADFTESAFSGMANFNNASFLDRVRYHRTSFSKAPWFHQANLHQDTSFHNCSFTSSVAKASATVLNFFGIPAPADADGKALLDFSITPLAAQPPKPLYFRAELGEDRESPKRATKQLEEDLRALGYIE